ALKVLQPHLPDRSGDLVGGLRDRRTRTARALAEIAEALGRVVVRCGQGFRLALQDTRALQHPAAEADNRAFGQEVGETFPARILEKLRQSADLTNGADGLGGDLADERAGE